MKFKIKVHHTEQAFKDKQGVIWYHVCFEVADFQYAWVLSKVPYQPDAEITVSIGRIISQDFNNGRATLTVA